MPLHIPCISLAYPLQLDVAASDDAHIIGRRRSLPVAVRFLRPSVLPGNGAYRFEFLRDFFSHPSISTQHRKQIGGRLRKEFPPPVRCFTNLNKRSNCTRGDLSCFRRNDDSLLCDLKVTISRAVRILRPCPRSCHPAATGRWYEFCLC